jgi:hypothetical protein
MLLKVLRHGSVLMISDAVELPRRQRILTPATGNWFSQSGLEGISDGKGTTHLYTPAPSQPRKKKKVSIIVFFIAS